jgi:DNA-binding transcriptional LysR family regulator
LPLKLTQPSEGGSAPALEILPRTILRFGKFYPGVELQMRDMSSASQLAALLDGRLDAVRAVRSCLPIRLSLPLLCTCPNNGNILLVEW